MRSAVMFVALLFAIVPLGDVRAQDAKPLQPAPQALPSTVGSAPVGHRQPKMSDVPLADRQKSDAQQDSRLKAVDIPDGRLRICTGC